MEVWTSCYRPKGSLVYYVQIRHKDSKKIIATRSTGERKKREAERAVPGIVQKVLELGDDRPEVLTFKEFCERYEREVIRTQADSTQEDKRAAINRINRQMKPVLVKNITAAKLSKLKADMIEEGLSMYSVKRNLSAIRRMLNWAHRMGYIEKVPFIDMPTEKELVRMKGRAISTEEFERILDKISEEVGEEREPEWRHFMRGLWISGLRRAEAVRLSWDEGDFTIDLKSKFPRFRILQSGQKSRKASRHPMTPDFFAFLMETPPESRTGPVFNPSAKDRGKRLTAHTAGKVISSCGKLAGVTAGKGKGGKTRYASAHDFRRSFGTRWSRVVEPDELRRLMRHVDLKTTLDFYVDGIDDDLASSVWEHATEEQLEILEG